MAITLNGTTGVTTTGLTSNGIDDNATSTAMTLDTSGNVLVGKTSSDFGATAGIELNGQYDVGYFTRSGDKPLVINRLTSDGTIADFRKDGTTVGSIGSSNSGYNLFITTSDTGLAFNYLADEIVPCMTNGAYRDAAIDLGDAAAKFKDLYLSGGVYLGGTGATNKLDDYEEGTWTPTWQTGNGDLSGFSNSSQIGTYTKIGNTVRIFFQLSTSNAASITGTGGIVVFGLPFPADDQSNAGVPVMVKTHDSRFLNDPYGVAEIQANATRIKLFKTQAMNNANALTVADMTKTNAGNYNLISGTCVYKTSS